MKKYVLLILAMMLVLAGCGSKNDDTQGQSLPTPAMIDVALTLSPDHIEAGTSVTISAKVTQANENVEDADEVLFEVWKKDDKEHEMINGVHQGEGVYTIEKSFDAEGVYYVISHVTARSMHNMPKKEFIVGNPEDHHDEATGHDEDEQSQHHHHSAISIQLEVADVIEANKETVLTANVHADDHTALTGADVQFEIWQDGDEKHYYVVANEVNDTYQASTTFSTQGKYNVRVHVLKGELHDHLEETVDVK